MEYDIDGDGAHSNCQPGSCSLLDETDSVEHSTEPLFEDVSTQIYVKNSFIQLIPKLDQYYAEVFIQLPMVKTK